MILGFMRNLPWGEPTNFRQKISDGRKKHTFRAGNRWAPGNRIHFYDGGRFQNPEPFNPAIIHAAWWEVFNPETWRNTAGIYSEVPHSVAVPVVYAIQAWEISYSPPFGKLNLKIGSVEAGPDMKKIVAENDGLTEEQFRRFFRRQWEKHRKRSNDPFTGQIIHWQTFNYGIAEADHIQHSELLGDR